MYEMKIRTESLAARCEICHQADNFNPRTNVCLRCVGIKIKQCIFPSKKPIIELPPFLRVPTPEIGSFEKVQKIFSFVAPVPYILMYFIQSYDWSIGIFLLFSSLLFITGLIILIYGKLKDKDVTKLIFADIVAGFPILLIIMMFVVAIIFSLFLNDPYGGEDY